ncbi:hypothetical protein NFI96_026207 [Prochilodus magdalenae]|nr:hypothetical protein NFI96_026207 [Prochilodus magdalenae]
MHAPLTVTKRDVWHVADAALQSFSPRGVFVHNEVHLFSALLPGFGVVRLLRGHNRGECAEINQGSMACDRDSQCGGGMCCAVSLWIRSLRMCTPMGLEGEECHPMSHKLEHPHTVPADGAVGVEVEGHQVFWTCDTKPFISVLTTVPPHTDSLGVSTKTKAGLVTEDDPLPF